MAKRVFLIIFLCLQTFLLCGYVSTPQSVRPVVTQVDLYYTRSSKPARLHLEDQEKMEAVLGCLRASNSHVIAQNQHPKGESACVIRVCLADGSQHIYRQVSDSFFSKDLGAWKTINPKQGMRLFSLISVLEAAGFQGTFLLCPGSLFPITKTRKIFC